MELSLEEIRRAHETLEKESIPESYEEYVSHLAVKPSDNTLKNDQTLVSLLPIDLVIHHLDPGLRESMGINLQNLEIDKIRVRENDERLSNIKPLPLETVSSVVLVPGKLPLKKKRRRKSKDSSTGEKRKKKSKKRKRRTGEEGDPPRKKKKRKKVCVNVHCPGVKNIHSFF